MFNLIISQIQQTVTAKNYKFQQKVSDTLKLAGHHRSLLFVQIFHDLSDLQVSVDNAMQAWVILSEYVITIEEVIHNVIH